jgi:hypothetical protein
MTETEVRTALEQILSREAAPEVDWAKVEELCLALNRGLVENPQHDWPPIVWSFVDDAPIRRKDPAYAAYQRNRARRYVDTGEYDPATSFPWGGCLFALASLVAFAIWFVT